MNSLHTSVSSSWTRSPAVLTKFHIIEATSSAPWLWLALLPLSSLLLNDPGPGVLEGFVVRIEPTWPFVFKIAPEARSRTIVARTPGFLESRPKVSSSPSEPGPFVIKVKPGQGDCCDRRSTYQSRV